MNKEIIHSLHQRALSVARNFRKTESELLEVLIQIEDKKVYLVLGFSSLFRYCMDALKLSEAQAYQYIGVSRKSREVPELKKAVNEGSVNISNARRIVSVITPQNKEIWIEKARALSQRELEREVVKENPREGILEKIRPVAPERSELRMGISAELERKLKRTQDLLSQKTQKPCSMEEALEAMVECYLEKNDPIRKAERVLCSDTVKKQVQSRIGKDSENKRTSTPKSIEHRVNLRDGRRCTHIDKNGKRCEQTRWLSLHHIKPLAQGGEHSVNNLTTLCHTHHNLIHSMPLQTKLFAKPMAPQKASDMLLDLLVRNP